MDTIIKICFYGSLVLPPILFICVLWRFQKLSLIRRALVAGHFACAAFATLMILAASIFLRDGLGPDTVESYGIDALANCWDGVVLAVIIGAILTAFGTLLATQGEKKGKRFRLVEKGLICTCLIVGGGWIAKEIYQDSVFKSELRPNVFSTTYPKWLFDSGGRIDFDAHEALVISNWISTNKTGWEFGSDGDFDPQETQFSADNYTVQIDKKKIVIQYYKSEADYTNDPSDSYIVIKRPLATGDQAFWAAQVNQVKAAAKVEVKVP